jgi:hypothetical protein
MGNKREMIARLAQYCHYSQPGSGCILSEMGGKSADELRTHLRSLDEKVIDRIISYHEACPYRDRVLV